MAVCEQFPRAYKHKKQTSHCITRICLTIVATLTHLATLIACLDLQEFEKKEHKLKARAATNLAFLYSLEGDSANAERYADLAVGTDKYSAQALVNKVS